jgi:hypothetical protein
MKHQLRALFLGVSLSLASAGGAHAMSTLISLSKEPIWPTSSTPDSNVVYSVTAVGRAGAGLLEVTLTADSLPPGVTVTFSPSVLRFTGNELTAQTATMTVSCPGLLPLDCFPFTITATSQRETLTITNQVCDSVQDLAVKPATLMLDQSTNGNLRVRGAGASAKNYQVLASPSLTKPVWTPVGSAAADGNGRFTFFTPQAAVAPVRFFRAVARD